MRFYRSEVLVTGSEWSDNMKNGRMMREQLRRIAAKGEPFNQKIKHSAFFFVADADEEAVILGIFWKGTEQPDKQLEANTREYDVAEKELDIYCGRWRTDNGSTYGVMKNGKYVAMIEMKQ